MRSEINLAGMDLKTGVSRSHSGYFYAHQAIAFTGPMSSFPYDQGGSWAEKEVVQRRTFSIY